MAEKNEDAGVTTQEDGQSNEDNLSLGEWTLLDKMSRDSIEKTVGLQKRNIICSKKCADAEVAREAIQVLEQPLLSSETVPIHSNGNNRAEQFVENDKDSDGQAVTTGKHDENSESRSSTISNSSANKIVKPIGTFTNIIIACLLAGVIGFGIGCVVSRRGTQLSGHEIDLRYGGNMAYSDHEDKSARQTVWSDVNIETTSVKEQPEEILEEVLYNEQFMNIDENNQAKNDGSLQAILEKIKFSLDVLCSIIKNKTHESRESNEDNAVCAEPLTIINLIELKNNMQSLIKDIGFIEDHSNEWFMNNINSKFEDISFTLINDLSMTIRNSVAKIERKFDKMKSKLDQRLCFIQNTIGDDVRIQRILNKYKSSFKDCPTTKSDNEVKIEPVKYKLERKKRYIREHIHTDDVGLEEKVAEFNNENSDIREDYKDCRKKENSIITERDKSYKWKKDQKSQKKFPKGDFTSEREAIESKKFKTKKIRERVVVLPNTMENSKDERDAEQICDMNSCDRQRIGGRKRDLDPKYGNRQLQRSEGRFNSREKKNVFNEDDGLSWSDKRARAHGNAREKY